MAIGQQVKNAFTSTESYLLNLKDAASAVLKVLKPTAKEREFLVNPRILLTNDNSSTHLTKNESLYNEIDITTGGLAERVAQHLPCFTHQPNSEGVKKPSLFHWIIAIIFCPILTCVHFICPSSCCSKLNSGLSACHIYSIPWGCNCCLCLNRHPNELACSQYYPCQLVRKAYLSSITFYGAIFLFLCFIIYSTYDTFIFEILNAFELMSDELAVMFFLVLFTIASFPLVWGYVLLNLAAGYKFGVFWGVLLVMCCVTCGLTIAHKITKRFCLNCIMGLLQRRSNYSQIEAILKVLDTPAGLKIIALTRLTPIPFGLVNGLFSASNISTRHYVAASNIGLLPTQILNCYIGSTFHSASDIINSGGSAGSYFIFVCQLVLGFTLMAFVIRHARKELSTALGTTDEGNQKQNLSVDNDEELTEITVDQPKSSVTLL